MLLNEKHAYLIIANNKFEQLQFLIDLIDNELNDIYIMIDKKVKKTPKLNTKFSNLILVDRIPIYWGDYSLVEAEIILMRESRYNNNYCYYHIISGVDLPIVDQNTIHNFFEKHPKKIFINYSNKSSNIDLSNRTKKYSFTSCFRPNRFVLFFKIYRKVEKFFLLFQKERINIEGIKHASNWVTIDNETVELIIKDEKWIKNTLKRGFLVDELFLPLCIIKYDLYDKIYYDIPTNDLKTDFQGNLNYINWWDGSPYIWTDGDIDQLIYARSKGHFFSRKFDIEKSPKLKKWIVKVTSGA